MTPSNADILRQHPDPGTRMLRFRGDLLRFSLTLGRPIPGTAWLRTNIGHADIGRREIIRAVDREEALLGRDWFDIPMVRKDTDLFELNLPLNEVGHFEAKCYFQQEGQDVPLWPAGPNVVVNVEPAETCCSNIIYNAFVRQFGPNKCRFRQLSEEEQQVIARLDEARYSVIPPSGTFRDLIEELDFIIQRLGCRYIQLLPINPTPTTYARMGRFGSPYAALGFTGVDPALARFDPKATPLEQFVELVDAVHQRGGRILLDIAINHTGWAAALHETHSQWLKRDPEGRIENPGAWGITWEDLTELDYRHRDLWRFMARVFLTWCRRGVDGFRCDAGYKISAQAWRYMIARVRDEYPDTLFFLEGLGGKISVTRDLLNRANFNWAYSELFQNYDRGQIEFYLPEALEISKTDGITVHFCETHDNNRLAATSHRWARMRTALCALSSVCGGFAFANGVEWFATEKINVHGDPSLNWGAGVNQVEEIRRLSRILRNHPAFFDRTRIEMVQEGGSNSIVLLRHHEPSGRRLLVVANLDADHAASASWKASRTRMTGPEFVDLLSGRTLSIPLAGNLQQVPLEPGQVLCLSDRKEDLVELQNHSEPEPNRPARIRLQRLCAKALDILVHFDGQRHMEAAALEDAAGRLAEDPILYFQERAGGGEPKLVLWQWPVDTRREVMVPPNHFLLVTAPSPFQARIMEGGRCLATEDSFQSRDGSSFCLFLPFKTPSRHRKRALRLSVYEEATKALHGQASLLYLAPSDRAWVKGTFRRPDLLVETDRILLGTNGLGGMLRASVSWGRLASRYDALLAANLNPEAPDDRRILLARYRAWLVFQGTSQDIGDECLDAYMQGAVSRGFWRFRVPTGQGQHVVLAIGMEMIPEKNTVRTVFYREPAGRDPAHLADEKPVRIIVRPDIEDRSFHEVTKAFLGPEHHFPASVRPFPDGFDFCPAPDRSLSVRISSGRFYREPEWHYMVYRPIEAERGLDPDSDLFSPGYFEVRIAGGQSVELSSSASQAPEPFFADGLLEAMLSAFDSPPEASPLPALERALPQYVVRRRKLSTVIAGYPWFLDWGRDTLIFVRGLIAAGHTDTSSRILKQFALFEEKGTLPNMIRGSDARNRDTSDAPLWFFVACADLAAPDPGFLKCRVGNRTIGRILQDMAQAMVEGSPNGIRMDPESALLFSPSHFTWMDTNHPAATPRQGYPVEIQALWWFALDFLARTASKSAGQRWAELAQQCRQSLLELFSVFPGRWLSDCLHAAPGTGARRAKPDDALRPNQLFALTLGAVTDPSASRRILEACSELLVPGAIRSLADRPLTVPLPILHHGRPLVDPNHPYQGRYQGDEDSRRKPAYHNGTAWSWVFPSFCEAWVRVYGEAGRDTALSFLGSCSPLLEVGCLGHLPEILDGDAPHAPRGCDAQAWSVSEFYRVWKRISQP